MFDCWLYIYRNMGIKYNFNMNETNIYRDRH